MTTCGACPNPLTGSQRRWCSAECQKAGARAVRLAAVFNITPAEYDLILAEQDGHCGICPRLPREGKRLAVDHDHKTGHVRGLLCYPCNRRVISARSADILVAAAAYVTDPPARRALGRDVVAPGRPPQKRKPRPRRNRQRRAA